MPETGLATLVNNLRKKGVNNNMTVKYTAVQSALYLTF